MKVAKRFRWEAAHRLPWHEGQCKYVHGHSYRMMVEVEGETDDRGMLIDFKHLKRVLKPLIEKWDHATLIANYDKELREAIESLGSRYYVLPFDSTAENLCTYVAHFLGTEAYDVLKKHRVDAIRVRVYETETCYAEIERPLSDDSTKRKNGALREVQHAS